MSKDRKRRAAPEKTGKPAPKDPPPALNTPFLLAKEQLAGLVKPPPKPKKEEKGPRAAPARKAPEPPPKRQQSDEELFLQEMWGVRRIVDCSGERAERSPSDKQAPPRPSEGA